jgi:hypothetical protein
MTSDLTGCGMVYVVEGAVVEEPFGSRAARFWRAGGTVLVQLPGLTVVEARDQRTPTNAREH